MRSQAGLLAVLSAMILSSPLDAQVGRLRRAAREAAGDLVDPSALLRSPPPITTNLRDARWAVDSLDAHNPDPSGFTPLASLDRGPNGGFLMRPGHFGMQAQSYCLHAGTRAPGGGDGYLYAPPLGSADDHVMAILRNSVGRPEIPQRKVQLLLWAIVARAKFQDLQGDLKAVAAQLLTPQQLATLNRGALDLVPGPVLDRALAGMPPLVRQALEAEARLRQMLVSADATFEDMERVAVLTGSGPPGEGSRDVPSGRWSLHPDGYYVRYIPSGYSSTRLEIWVPEGSRAVGREFDPATHIAVPGNTARQRLIQSARQRAS